MPAVPENAAARRIQLYGLGRQGSAALVAALAVLFLGACASAVGTVSPLAPTPTPAAPLAQDSTAAPSSTAAPDAPTALPTPSSTPTPTPTPVPSPVGQEQGQGQDWELIFSDDFDEIDRSKWETGWFSSTDFSPSVNENGAACFHPDQVSAVDGSLVLKVQAETDSDCRLRDGSQANYVAGLMNTRESFEFTYGYAEARMFLAADGDRVLNWPAFWQTGDEWPVTGEIDIAEGLSGGVLCSVYHHEGDDGEPVQERGCVDWDDPGGWHVFAAKWEPDRITYYYDGVEVFSTTTGVVDARHYLVIDYTVRNDGSAQVPSELAVDYIRVWDQGRD